jgi:phosphohistidine swiveling domain-containing protein
VSAIRPTFRNETMFGAVPDWSPVPSPDFTVAWSDPTDAELAWDRDEMHHPFALAPLSIDFVRNAAGAGFDIAYEFFGLPTRVRTAAQHGYMYFAPVWGVPDSEVPGLKRTMNERFRAFGAETAAYWATALPELLAIYEQMTSIDVERLPGKALADAWLKAWAGLRRAWGIHMVVIRGPFRASEDLADLYARLVPDAATGAGYRLIQGRVDVLHDVELGIERLAELAAVDRGPAFDAALEAFLARHGHLGQTSVDLSQASWAEEPTLVLAEVAKRLEHPSEPAADRRVRLLAEADAMADDVRTRLRDRPQDLADFEAALALAREIGPLTETHNYWIDRMSVARMRALALRVGRRLSRDGLIGEASDVEYLSYEEIADLLIEPRRVAALIEERRAEHARQKTLVPPPVIGGIGAAASSATRVESTSAPRESPSANGASPSPHPELRGTGASAGIVRGPARVTLGAEGFDRIRPGDIIVSPSTTPSWVPVFTVAAGLVTNTGGILAHAAVVAREFGLPAVVGVAGATSRIPDGAVIEIDGTAGTVRFVDDAIADR